MRPLRGQYPHDLGRVVGHAKRLIRVMAELEKKRPEKWFLGRPGEVRGFVSSALADWRSGEQDSERTGAVISSYLDALHRGAARKLRSAWALECCAADEVITAVASEEAPSLAGGDTTRGLSSHGGSLLTERTGWVDSPEMLARVQSGLALVEMQARRLVRRLGEGTATMDDLRAFGREGLLDAARAFDEGRSVPFEAWASLRIRSAMIDGVRRWGFVSAAARKRAQTAPLEEKDGIGAAGLGALLLDEPSDGRAPKRSGAIRAGEGVVFVDDDASRNVVDGQSTPEEAVARAQLLDLVRRVVADLPKRERELIERSYFEELNLQQAAAAMGASPSWASRVHAHAMETIRRKLRHVTGT